MDGWFGIVLGGLFAVIIGGLFETVSGGLFTKNTHIIDKRLIYAVSVVLLKFSEKCLISLIITIFQVLITASTQMLVLLSYYFHPNTLTSLGVAVGF